MLNVDDFDGLRFIDVGCGSGLFSLAARNLGSTVLSFDFDADSVACARFLRERHRPGDVNWKIEQGSILDDDFIRSLGQFDIVYAWGVLHHTGQMWNAIDAATTLLANDSLLYLAIYNDQGWRSRYWTKVKYLYNRCPPCRWVLIAVYAPYFVIARYLVRRLSGKGRLDRGMSLWYDMIDWLGGTPFEVALPGEVVEYFRRRGMRLQTLRTCGGRSGCNEYVLASGSRFDATASRRNSR